MDLNKQLDNLIQLAKKQYPKYVDELESLKRQLNALPPTTNALDDMGKQLEIERIAKMMKSYEDKIAPVITEEMMDAAEAQKQLEVVLEFLVPKDHFTDQELKHIINKKLATKRH